MYYTQEVKIAEYGWTVKFYEPTYGEVSALSNAASQDAIREMLPNLIVEWDCTGRDGSVLPKTKEGIEQLPARVVVAIAQAIFNSVKSASDPKPVSAS